MLKSDGSVTIWRCLAKLDMCHHANIPILSVQLDCLTRVLRYSGCSTRKCKLWVPEMSMTRESSTALESPNTSASGVALLPDC